MNSADSVCKRTLVPVAGWTSTRLDGRRDGLLQFYLENQQFQNNTGFKRL